jgi:hypothetical protein
MTSTLLFSNSIFKNITLFLYLSETISFCLFPLGILISLKTATSNFFVYSIATTLLSVLEIILLGSVWFRPQN